MLAGSSISINTVREKRVPEVSAPLFNMMSLNSRPERRGALIPRMNSLTQEDMDAITSRTGCTPVAAPNWDLFNGLICGQDDRRQCRSNSKRTDQGCKRKRQDDAWSAEIKVDLESPSPVSIEHANRTDESDRHSTRLHLELRVKRLSSESISSDDNMNADIPHPSELYFATDQEDLGSTASPSYGLAPGATPVQVSLHSLVDTHHILIHAAYRFI